MNLKKTRGGSVSSSIEGLSLSETLDGLAHVCRGVNRLRTTRGSEWTAGLLRCMANTLDETELDGVRH